MHPTNDKLRHVGLALGVDVSRRAAVRGMGGAGLAALLLTGGVHSRARPAHSASLPPTQATGVFVLGLGGGEPAATPGLELTLRRVTVAPGGVVPAHSHPGALVIAVEAGAFAYTALGGTALVYRASADGTPAIEATAEAAPIGTEIVLGPGEWLFADNPQDVLRNAGDEDLVFLIAGLTRLDQPFTQFMDDMPMDAKPAP